MSIELAIQDAVKLDATRCFDCGRWWAYERFTVESPRCPVCAGRAIDVMTKLGAQQDRTIAALRGALTRRKRSGA